MRPEAEVWRIQSFCFVLIKVPTKVINMTSATQFRPRLSAPVVFSLLLLGTMEMVSAISLRLDETHPLYCCKVEVTPGSVLSGSFLVSGQFEAQTYLHVPFRFAPGVGLRPQRKGSRKNRDEVCRRVRGPRRNESYSYPENVGSGELHYLRRKPGPRTEDAHNRLRGQRSAGGARIWPG